MKVLLIGIKYNKSASRLLNRNWINKGGLDLSKEVLWVSVGWRGTELPEVKKKLPHPWAQQNLSCHGQIKWLTVSSPIESHSWL